MGKKKKKIKPIRTTDQARETEKDISIKPWILYLLAFIFIVTSTIFIYQEPIFQNKSISLADVKGQGVPFGHFKNEFEKEHNEPALWIPFIFSGMPYHASGSYRIRYTLEKCFWILPSSIGKSVNGAFGLNIILGGIFMLILMRSFGVGLVPSLLAAIAFIFTTKIIGTAHTNRITTFMHIPLIFYAVKEIWRKPRWWLVVVLGAAVGSQVGSYHPQVSHISVIFILMYLIYSIVIEYHEEKKWTGIIVKSGYLAAGLFIAVLLAAIVIIPLAEYSPYSIRGAKTALSTGGGGLSSSYATMWSFSWTEILTFIIPGYVGFGHQTYWGQMPFAGYPNYLGVSVVILGLLYVIIAKKDKYRIFWISSFIIVLLIAMGKNLPPVSDLMLNYFPFYNKFREPSMITIINSLIAAITAGLFVSYLKNLADAENEILRKWILRFSIFFGILMVGFVMFSSPLQSFYFDIYQSADKEMNRYAQYSLQQLRPLYDMRFTMLKSDVIRISAIALAALGLIWAFSKQKLSYNVLSILLVGIVVIDLFIPNRESVKKEYTSTEKPEASFLKGNAVADWLNQREKMPTYRILPVEDFSSNEYVYYGIASVGGYHAVKMANYQAYLDQVTFNNRLLINMLATKYIIASRKFQLPGTELIANIGGKNIYLNNEALPYARFVSRIRVENDRTKIIDAIKKQNFDTAEMAYIETENKIQDQQFQRDSLSTIIITNKHAQLMEIISKNRNDGFMVISEMHYPTGWRTYMNDEPIEIFYVNAGLMGIFVPAGENKIIFRYEQPSFYYANMISRVSFWMIILVLLGLAGNNIYANWKNRQDEVK